MHTPMLRSAPLLAGLLLWLVAGCSGSTEAREPPEKPLATSHGDTDAGPETSPTISVGEDAAGFGPLGCGAGCVSPRQCGRGSLTCLDPGACVVSADCPDGQICNAMK